MTTVDPKDPNHGPYQEYYPSSPPYPDTIGYYDTSHVLHGRSDQFFTGEPSDLSSLPDQRLSLTLGSEIQIPSFHFEVPSLSVNVSGSRYLKSTQELLDEVVNVRAALKNSRSEQKSTAEEPSSNQAHEREHLHNKMAKLMAMLDQVDRKYTNYRQQMHLMVSSFDSVVGQGAAKPYTELVLKTISRQFRTLRDAINGQISSTRRILGEEEPSTARSVGMPRLRSIDQKIRDQRVLHQLTAVQQAWRPQRGLPETSVSILRAWLFEHFLHPYPKDSDKMMLASQTGLTRSQVSNWFINARVRLWKPMIEEMYEQELREAGTRSTDLLDECGEIFQEQVPAQTDEGQREMPVRLTLGLRNSVGGSRAPAEGEATAEYESLNIVDRRHRFGGLSVDQRLHMGSLHLW